MGWFAGWEDWRVGVSDRPAVSVVTPVYNGDKFLAECIESVLNQTYPNFEYLIVNNCSTDRTLEIAQSYARKDSRIRVHDITEFLPLTANHNRAWRLISPDTRYGKFVCADDLIMPDCLRQMVELADANPSVGIVGAYQQSLKRILWQGFRYPQAVFSGREVCRRIFLGDDRNFGCGSPTSLLYRADLIRINREFFPNSSVHADTSACFATLRDSDYGFVYSVLSYERIHEETATFTSLRLNRYLPAYLNDLLKYGPAYLSDDELHLKLKECLYDYHRFLAASCLKSRDAEFWNYHRSSLAELGFPIKNIQLVKAAVTRILKEFAKPVDSVSNFLHRERPNQAPVTPPQPPKEQANVPAAHRS
jgi:glycosyltransferase involved in cell wall biosynthesis